jgi:hypothetical protein
VVLSDEEWKCRGRITGRITPYIGERRSGTLNGLGIAWVYGAGDPVQFTVTFHIATPLLGNVDDASYSHRRVQTLVVQHLTYSSSGVLATDADLPERAAAYPNVLKVFVTW